MTIGIGTSKTLARLAGRLAKPLAGRLVKPGGVAEILPGGEAAFLGPLPVDALPGVGNAAVPRKLARDDGVTSGQGCGHNLFGAASVAAAMARQEPARGGQPGRRQIRANTPRPRPAAPQA